MILNDQRSVDICPTKHHQESCLGFLGKDMIPLISVKKVRLKALETILNTQQSTHFL